MAALRLHNKDAGTSNPQFYGSYCFSSPSLAEILSFSTLFHLFDQGYFYHKRHLRASGPKSRKVNEHGYFGLLRVLTINNHR